ncbi:putative bifunctional diguanylate cyclase/phosphodiesterase [Propionivibrio dicarboxylicus]|uniref:Diguanylate cyclase (GGDEF) domain-containing protein n=1 Tax=Propionivibrio dicarboxylicus TaxID=83767 RepID=A0A1G7XXL0_9RHOO|nr:EAL domain-containing protein [Propionivibrio dicarboxylicus]SDG88823.1 diguanylate cyclase (GGDEF) domain-containing protein [Propionivibrio dicarboxylicus]
MMKMASIVKHLARWVKFPRPALAILGVRNDLHEDFMQTAISSTINPSSRHEGVRGGERDAMTGLWNRSVMQKLAEPMALHSRLHGGYLAVVWLDLDRFQHINHALGDVGGDHVIRIVAERIRLSAVPAGELIRVGNDEFVVLIPGCSHRLAIRYCRTWLREVRKPLRIGGESFRLSASIGLALWRDGERMSTVLARADHARSLAKTNGGDRIAYVGGLDDEALVVVGAREHLRIENALHDALDADSLEQAYQPLVTATGEIEAVEALVRCGSDWKYSVAPARLVQIAEASGKIVQLGKWALRLGIRRAEWLMAHGLPTKVAINVSAAQIGSASFSSMLNRMLDDSVLPPDLLELELTESTFFGASTIVWENLRAIRKAGISLAIDDFGTGYSSLASLRDIPATKIKLDRSFIARLPGDDRTYSIVTALTRLAHELGMRVVAEGIETTAQAVAIVAAGVDAFQGFHYAPPMTADELLAWLARRVPAANDPHRSWRRQDD